MNGRRAIVGLCMLCALAFTAIAAQSASAATKGTTAFTCVNQGPKHIFGDADCENNVGGEYEHVPIAENLDTTVKLTPQIQKFKSTVGGVAFTLATESLEIVPSTAKKCTNMKEASGANVGEHFFDCKGLQLTYSNVIVEPAALKCAVKGLKPEPVGAGMITTEPLTLTTTEKQDTITLTPENEGKVFTEFEFTNNPECALVGQKVKVVGSITLTTKGATLIAEHAPVTASKSLRLSSAVGPVAGYEGVSTISAAEKEPETHHALSMTTVETA